MFSRLTADRFEDRHKDNSIGPGSYDLPDTNDDRAPSLAVPGDRFNENGSATPGPGFYTKDGQEVAELAIQQLSTRSRMSTAGSKENRPPSARGKNGQCPLTREIEQLKRQFNQAERQKEQDNAKLQKSLDSHQVQLRDARERADRAEANVRAKTEELKKVEVKINVSEDHVRKCNDRAAKQEARISELGSKAEESRKAAEHSERVASERSDHIKRLQVEAGARTEDVTRLEATVARLEKDSSVKKVEFEVAVARLKEDVGAKDVELAKLSVRLGEVFRQGEQAVADLQRTLDDSQTQLSNAEQRADTAEVDAAKKAEDLAHLATVVAALEEQVRSSHAKNQEQESRITDLSAKAESDSRQICADEITIARLEEDVGTKEHELAKVGARLEEAVQEGKETAADLKRSLDDVHTQLSNSMKRADNAEADAATKAESLAHAEAAVATLEQHVSQGSEKHREQESCIADVMQKIRAAEATVARLEEDCGSKDHELARVQKQLQEALHQRELTAGDLQSSLHDVQSQLKESKKHTSLAEASAALKAEELARAETMVAALEEQVHRGRERLQEQESCIADLTVKSEADSRKIRASEAAIEDGRAKFDEAMRKMSDQFTELQEKLGEFQSAREKQERHALDTAREAREAEERMRHLDNARRRLKEREVHQAASAVINGVLFRVMSAESQREQEAQRDEIARLADVERTLRNSLNDCGIRQSASVVVNTTVISALSTEARRDSEVQRVEIEQISDAFLQRDEQFRVAESQIMELTQKLADIETRLVLDAQQRDLEQAQLKVELAESSASVMQHREALESCDKASREIQSLELRSFSCLVVHQALLKASHALGEQAQQEGTKIINERDVQLAQIQEEKQRQAAEMSEVCARLDYAEQTVEEARHTAHQYQFHAEERIRSTSAENDSRMTELRSEIGRLRSEMVRLADTTSSLTISLEEKEIQRVAAAVVCEVLCRTIFQEARGDLEGQRARTAEHADAERSLINSLNDCNIRHDASVAVNSAIVKALSAEALCEFQMQRAETAKFSDSCSQYHRQLQDVLSQRAGLVQKLEDAETRLALEAQRRDLEQSQFKVELAESQACTMHHREASQFSENVSREIQTLELQSFSRLVVHQVLLKASYVLGEQDQQEGTKTIDEKDVQLAQLQEGKQQQIAENDELYARLDHAEKEMEEARHSARQSQFDAEERIRRASLESESRATELWSEIDRLRGDATRCEALEKQVSTLGRAKVAAESAVRESQRNLERCQQKVEHLEAQESRTQRQCEELNGLRRENEEQQEQIRQISASLQQFQGKNEALKRDNRSLEEKVACMEGDLERVADQHAKLMGHANHQQKIRYTLRLKEESFKMRQELHKAQQRVAQVEENASRGCGSSLFDVFLLQAGAQSHKSMEPQLVRTPGRQQPAATSATPRQTTTPSSRTPRAAGSSMRFSRSSAGKEHDTEELRQRCKLQERALERIRADFQHVLTLVERAADAGDGGVEDSGLAGLLEQLRNEPGVSAQPVSSEPPRTPQRRRSLEGHASPFGGSAADDFADGQSLTGEGGDEGRQD